MIDSITTKANNPFSHLFPFLIAIFEPKYAPIIPPIVKHMANGILTYPRNKKAIAGRPDEKI